MKTAVCIALSGLLIGCHDHDYDVVNDPASSWYYRYDNGHPLAASSSESQILAAEEDLISRINAHRVAIGKPALIDDPGLRDLARAHSIHMARHDFTWSVNPEGDDPGDRADNVGIPWTEFAENVVFDLQDPGDAYHEMTADPWMHDHIDDSRFTSFGVGYEHDASSWHNDYWTVDFREP